MTVNTTTNRARESGNGVKTEFDFSFKVFKAADLVIYKIDTTDESSTTLVLNTDYTVSLNTVTDGGTVTIIGDVFTSDEDILILREAELKQESDFPVANTFPAESVENALDLAMMILQQLNEIIDRSITLAVTSSTTGVTLPEPEADKAVKWNSAGTNLENSEYDPDAAGDSAVASAASAAESAVSAAAALVSENNAATSEANAAASAASVNLPSIDAGDAGKGVMVNSGGTGYELTDFFPSGGIIMWSGSIVSIPTGWVLCDGNNSTPNLQDKFIVGAGDTYAVDGTGGTVSHNHTVDSHLHTVDPPNTTSGSSNNNEGFDRVNTFPDAYAVTSHTHNVNIAQFNSGSATPDTDAVDNLPPYYALAYIMKS